VHDDEGVDVRSDGRVVGQNIKEARSLAVLPRAGRRVVAEGDRERQHVTLRRVLVIADQQAAEAGVEALVLAEDLVGADGSQRERDRQGDDERQALVQGDKLVDALQDPVGEGIDASGMRSIGARLTVGHGRS